MYTSFSAVKLFLYKMKYLYFINLSIITNIALYSTFISDFLNFNSFTIKLSATLNYDYIDVTGNFNSLYNL